MYDYEYHGDTVLLKSLSGEYRTVVGEDAKSFAREITLLEENSQDFSSLLQRYWDKVKALPPEPLISIPLPSSTSWRYI